MTGRLLVGLLTFLPVTVVRSSTAEAAEWEVDAPSVASNGISALIVWAEGPTGNTNIHGRFISSLTDPQGTVFEISVAPGNQQNPVVAWSGDRFTVAWEDLRTDPAGDIWATTVGADGSIGAEYAVTQLSGVREVEPALAGRTNVALVTWTRGPSASSDIWARRMRPAGGVLGASFAVNRGQRGQLRPSIAERAGEFLVVWEDRRSGNGSDILGTRITAAGLVRDGLGRTVNSNQGNQTMPKVASGGNGFYAVWQDERGDGGNVSGTGITPDGSPRSRSGVKIAWQPGVQSAPAVAGTGVGYAVAWVDERPGMDADLRGTAIQDGKVLFPDGLHITFPPGAQRSVALSSTSFDPIATWVDDRAGYPAVFANGVQAATGGGQPGTNQISQPQVIDASMRLGRGGTTVEVEFSAPIDPATFTLDDLQLLNSAGAAEFLDGVDPVAGSDDRRFTVRVGGSRLDTGDQVSLIDGQPVNGLAEVRARNGIAQASTAVLSVYSPVPKPKIYPAADGASFLVVFDVLIDGTTLGPDDFALSDPSVTPASVALTGSGFGNIYRVHVGGGLLEPGDTIELLDGVPVDGSAEVETADGSKAELTSSTVAGAHPTVAMSGTAGRPWFRADFSEPMDPAHLSGLAFSVEALPGQLSPFVTALLPIADSGGRSWEVRLSGGLIAGQTMRLGDGVIPDGFADVRTAAGVQGAVPGSAMVAADHVLPVVTLTALEGRGFAVEFSETVTPALFGGFVPGATNVDDRFLLLQGTGASAPQFGGTAQVRCVGLRCTVLYSGGQPLVPGNTISVPAAYFTDLAGNSNAAVTVTVEDDTDAPDLLSARARIDHFGTDVAFVFVPSSGLTVTADAPGDSGLSIEAVAGSSASPMVEWEQSTGLITVQLGTAPGSNSAATIAALINDHPTLGALVTATPSPSAADLTPWGAIALVGGWSQSVITAGFSEDVVVTSMTIDIDGNTATTGDQLSGSFPAGEFGREIASYAVPFAIIPGTTIVLPTAVADFAGNPASTAQEVTVIEA